MNILLQNSNSRLFVFEPTHMRRRQAVWFSIPNPYLRPFLWYIYACSTLTKTVCGLQFKYAKQIYRENTMWRGHHFEKRHYAQTLGNDDQRFVLEQPSTNCSVYTWNGFRALSNGNTCWDRRHRADSNWKSPRCQIDHCEIRTRVSWLESECFKYSATRSLQC